MAVNAINYIVLTCKSYILTKHYHIKSEASTPDTIAGGDSIVPLIDPVDWRKRQRLQTEVHSPDPDQGLAVEGPNESRVLWERVSYQSEVDVEVAVFNGLIQ